MAIEKWWWGLWAVYLWDTLIAGWGWGGGGLNMEWAYLWVAAMWCCCFAAPKKCTIWNYTFFPVIAKGPNACNSEYWFLAHNNVDDFWVGYKSSFSCRYPFICLCAWIFCDKYPGVWMVAGSGWQRRTYYDTDAKVYCCGKTAPAAECLYCVPHWWGSCRCTHCWYCLARFITSGQGQEVYLYSRQCN